MPKYKPLANVAAGIKGQLLASMSALDLHNDLPPEAEELGQKLAEAYALSQTIVHKGEDEPDPDEE